MRSAAHIETARRHDRGACSYCCLACAHEARRKRSRVSRSCLNCGIAIWTYASQVGNNKSERKYCSKKCGDAHSLKSNLCPRCGVVFTYYQSVPRKYCSLECSGRAKTNLTRNCAACGTSFRYLPSNAETARFCSFKCKVVFEGAARRKPHTPKRFYSSTEWLTVRAEIIDRDGGACVRCGSMERLNVHHKNPYRLSGDNSPDNLITLCHSCHFIIECHTGNVTPEERLLKLAAIRRLWCARSADGLY